MPRSQLLALAVAGATTGLGLAGCGPDEGGTETCAGLLAGELVVTEVLADASGGGDEGHEWFELYNASSRSLELAGLVIEHGRPDAAEDARDRHTMTALSVPAGGYVVLGNVLPDLAPGHVDYGYADDLDGLYNSDQGRLALRCGAAVVDDAIYVETSAGRSYFLGGGAAPDYLANDDATRWCETEPGTTTEYEPGNHGTPGAANPACASVASGMCDDGGTPRAIALPAVGDLVITEVMPSPSVAGAEGDWFEVRVNRDVDLNGVGLDRTDDTAGADVLASTTCQRATAGTYLVFARNGDMTMNGGVAGVAGTFDFPLVAGSPADPTGLRLTLGATELDAMPWTGARAGRALQLDADLTAPADNDVASNLCDATTAYNGTDLGSPGAANADCPIDTTGMCTDASTGQLRPIVAPTAGQLVIDEWMPDPAGVDTAVGEWFELRATAAVDLNGLQAGTPSLGTTPIVAVAGPCVRLAAGGRAVFQKRDGTGLPGSVVVTGAFPFAMTNGASSFQIGLGGANLATATWTAASVEGSSFMLDSTGDQCSANLTVPAPIPFYAGSNRGTPGAANSTNAECP